MGGSSGPSKGRARRPPPSPSAIARLQRSTSSDSDFARRNRSNALRYFRSRIFCISFDTRPGFDASWTKWPWIPCSVSSGSKHSPALAAILRNSAKLRQVPQIEQWYPSHISQRVRRRDGGAAAGAIPSADMSRKVDTAVVLDLHHGAGFEQLGTGNPSDTRPRCVVGRGERRRAVAVRELRVGTSIGWSVHDRDAEVGTPACEPAQSSCVRSENCSSIIVSTRCAETGRRARFIILINNTNHSYSINARCQPRFRA